jgi:hypothetical protein
MERLHLAGHARLPDRHTEDEFFPVAAGDPPAGGGGLIDQTAGNYWDRSFAVARDPGTGVNQLIIIVITLTCSAKARKQFGLRTTPDLPEADWHEQWRLDTLDGDPCGHGAMVTNLETLFTILVPAGECVSFDRLFDHFRMRLQFTLIDAGSSVKVGKEPPCLVTGNPRQVIGTMNDMKFALALEVDEPSPHGRDPEDFLNRTPYSAIDYAPPVDRFYRRVAVDA